jgi:uncharacterized membrane protein YeaQ/YmgE (transglycosylase-associated protein family)
VQNPTYIQRGGKLGCLMMIIMGLVGCCHGFVFFVAYKLIKMKEKKVRDVRDE